jgi:hypothetical protein
MMPKAYDPNAGNMGGQLYCVNLGVQGKPDYKASVTVRKESSNRLTNS